MVVDFGGSFGGVFTPRRRAMAEWWWNVELILQHSEHVFLRHAVEQWPIGGRFWRLCCSIQNMVFHATPSSNGRVVVDCGGEFVPF